MDYDEFKSAFLEALRESAIPILGVRPANESLDLNSMERKVSVYVEPIDRDIGRPFHVAGEISWRWDSVHTARSRSTEEDLLTELLGREDAHDVETEPSFLRVDIELHATTEYGKALPMPKPSSWARWHEEAIGRLEGVERLVPAELTRDGPDGRLEILAWQGEPQIKVICGPGGELRLSAVSASAFQLIDIPRRWDDSDREPDRPPHGDLLTLLKRVKAALHAWGEALDHLTDQGANGNP